MDPLDIRCEDLYGKETRMWNCLRHAYRIRIYVDTGERCDASPRCTCHPGAGCRWQSMRPETVRELLDECNPRQLLRLRNFGKKTLHRLQQILWKATGFVFGYQCKTCGSHYIEATEGWEWFRCHECPPRWGRPEEFERTDS